MAVSSISPATPTYAPPTGQQTSSPMAMPLAQTPPADTFTQAQPPSGPPADLSALFAEQSAPTEATIPNPFATDATTQPADPFAAAEQPPQAAADPTLAQPPQTGFTANA